jgi:hypothetical protein
MAIAYHALLLPELLQESTEKIRATYDGPLTIAGDLMVWNVTKDKITLREAVVSEMPYPPPAGPEWGKACNPKGKRFLMLSRAVGGKSTYRHHCRRSRAISRRPGVVVKLNIQTDREQ